jgi:hypothetical protein
VTDECEFNLSRINKIGTDERNQILLFDLIIISVGETLDWKVQQLTAPGYEL